MTRESKLEEIWIVNQNGYQGVFPGNYLGVK